jgi:hypothetical protein
LERTANGAFQEDDLWQIKTGAAALAVCLVRTLEKSDPDFQDKFLENLDRAYYHFRDNNPATRADGSPREVLNLLEMLAWTRELLTGWSNVSGQNEPFLPPIS